MMQHFVPFCFTGFRQHCLDSVAETGVPGKTLLFYWGCLSFTLYRPLILVAYHTWSLWLVVFFFCASFCLKLIFLFYVSVKTGQLFLRMRQEKIGGLKPHQHIFTAISLKSSARHALEQGQDGCQGLRVGNWGREWCFALSMWICLDLTRL